MADSRAWSGTRAEEQIGAELRAYERLYRDWVWVNIAILAWNEFPPPEAEVVARLAVLEKGGRGEMRWERGARAMKESPEEVAEVALAVRDHFALASFLGELPEGFYELWELHTVAMTEATAMCERLGFLVAIPGQESVLMSEEEEKRPRSAWDSREYRQERGEHLERCEALRRVVVARFEPEASWASAIMAYERWSIEEHRRREGR